MYVSFQAHPEEISQYRDLAKADDRSLSWWIRNALNKAAAASNGGKSDENHETVGVAEISADRS